MRQFDNWLTAFKEYCQSSEAPEHVLFWVGVSAVAGALQRKVYFDMGKFRWYPNFFVILVGPPGIIAKSTTTSYAMDLLRKVDGIQFGPSVITWQALVLKFSKIGVDFISAVRDEHGKVTGGVAEKMAAVTLFSSELGNLIAQNDRDMLDTLTNLFDCASFSKETLKDGEKFIENPCLNLVACTTPEWISSNIPAYMIGGGLVSRCVMVYADTKRQLSAYPGMSDRADLEKAMLPGLVADLKEISEMTGEMQLTQQALEWGEEWYKTHWTSKDRLGDSRANGYIARKQTHVHKLAMVLSAAKSNSMIITRADLIEAERLVGELEVNMPFLFDQMGKSKEATQTERIVEFIRTKPGATLKECYHYVHKDFPRLQDFEAVMKGLTKSGHIAQGFVNGRLGYLVTDMPAAAVDSPSRGRK